MKNSIKVKSIKNVIKSVKNQMTLINQLRMESKLNQLKM